MAQFIRKFFTRKFIGPTSSVPTENALLLQDGSNFLLQDGSNLLLQS